MPERVNRARIIAGLNGSGYLQMFSFYSGNDFKTKQD